MSEIKDLAIIPKQSTEIQRIEEYQRDLEAARKEMGISEEAAYLAFGIFRVLKEKEQKEIVQ